MVRKAAPIELIVLASGPEVEKQVGVWRSDFDTNLLRMSAAESPAVKSASKWLRQNIWQPLEGRLDGARMLLISPDGSLSKLAFGALPGRREGEYLVEDWPLAIVPAPQALPELLAKPSHRAQADALLLVDAIDVDTPARATAEKRAGEPTNAKTPYGLQPGESSQTALIKDLYRRRFGSQGLTTLDAERATEEAFRREAAKPTFLHIHAHGFFGGSTTRYLLNRPAYGDSIADKRGLVTSQAIEVYHPNLLAGIALTGANQQKSWSMDDGRLVAEEIQTLDLRHADLVVLSSCETALGEATSGEGLISVQRAFHMAGASTVVAALWRVDAAANRELLTRFYDNFWNKGLSKLDALREAQLWMLRERGYEGVLARLAPPGTPATDWPPRLPPFLWAGFVLSGDWRGGGGRGVER